MNNFLKMIKGTAKKTVCSRFSALELLVAMTLVSIVTIMLVRFFSNMQNAWRYSVNATAVYEDSRIAFDVIMRDLQTAIAQVDYSVSQEIRFHQPNKYTLWFVAVSGENEDAPCNLAEIGYRFKDDELQRAAVDCTCSAWNVYGDRDDASDQRGYQRLIDGVEDVTFSCVNRAGNIYMPDNDPELPYAVTVQLTLIDRQTQKSSEKMPEEAAAELKKKMSRSFRKTIQVSGWPNKL